MSSLGGSRKGLSSSSWSVFSHGACMMSVWGGDCYQLFGSHVDFPRKEGGQGTQRAGDPLTPLPRALSREGAVPRAIRMVALPES